MFRPLMLLVVVGLCCALRAPAQIAAYAASDFPLAKGAYWRYQGTAKFDERNHIVTKPITIKMEVTELIQREHVTAAVMKGSFRDGLNADQGMPRSEYLFIRVGSCRVYELSGDAMTKALKRLRDKKDILIGLVEPYQLFLDLPLAPGKVFGADEDLTRLDGLDNTHRWLWMVENTAPFTAKSVRGVDPKARLTEFQLGYHTNPDEQKLCIVPTVGVTFYSYIHHGSVCETQVKLVEFHQGK